MQVHIHTYSQAISPEEEYGTRPVFESRLPHSTSCVTLSKLLYLSVHMFHNCRNQVITEPLIRLLGGFNG